LIGLNGNTWRKIKDLGIRNFMDRLKKEKRIRWGFPSMGGRKNICGLWMSMTGSDHYGTPPGDLLWVKSRKR